MKNFLIFATILGSLAMMDRADARPYFGEHDQETLREELAFLGFSETLWSKVLSYINSCQGVEYSFSFKGVEITEGPTGTGLSVLSVYFLNTERENGYLAISMRDNGEITEHELVCSENMDHY